eukprot:11226212-Lingulodinium_polyedra.AAC.1
MKAGGNKGRKAAVPLSLVPAGPGEFDTIMEDIAKVWRPPGATMCEGRVHSRWLVKFGPHGSKSR